MSLVAVPDGKLAAVVTYLEMTSRPEAGIPASTIQLVPVVLLPKSYRNLFARIGAPWLWFSRLIMPDAELASILDHARVTLFEVRAADAVIGMLELDAREDAACELAFVGLIPEFTGQGHGRWLIAEAVARAWSFEGVERIHVHTCSLDHPAALAAYRRAGFVAVRRAVETFVDPRLAGVLPREVAPHVPLIDPPRS
ncbi:MAG TPA: GNAT family N-acetyltransferase [Sphingomicrobium sp.]|nr:GNAT family N-acetyltransferase [Sphingomicrobium sp.]